MLDFSEMTDADLAEMRHTPIRISTIDIRADKVRLGITAPRSIAIHRREVYDAIKAQNSMAGKEK